MKWARLLVWLPLGAGILAALLLTRLLSAVPVLFVRADLATWALLIGALVSIAAGAIVWQREANWRRERQRVLQAATERRRFVQRLDHELKNPLTAIRAGLANLADAPFEDAQREALLSVEAQAMRLSELLANLRKLADLETRPIDRTPINLEELLREVLVFVEEQPEAGDRQVTLTLPRVPWPVPVISGDHDLLFLAVHNLISNALKFTQPGDAVEVRALEDGSTVAIQVADSGPGIPANEVPHVWEELYRGQGARGVPGSGLGLALVRAIAERHGGSVSLRSRAGQGSVFTLRLPIG